MPIRQATEYFCIFCYKTVNCSEPSSNTDCVKKFIKILGRFAGRNVQNGILSQPSITQNLNALLFNCCKQCRKIADQFCTLYHQFKLLELELDSKLDKLVGKLEHANKVPTRWIHLNKVLEDMFPEELCERKKSQRIIRELRQSVVESVKLRTLQSQPRVLLEKTKELGSNIKQLDNCDDSLTLNSTVTDDPDNYTEDNLPDFEEDSYEIETKYSFQCGDRHKALVQNCDREPNGVDVTKPFKERQFISTSEDDNATDMHEESEDDNKETRRLTTPRTIVRGPTSKYKVGTSKKSKRNGKGVQGKTACHICGRKLGSRPALLTHLIYHQDPKDWQYKCDECGKKFARKPDLDAHMKKHTREQPYVCKICGEKYGYRISLRRHLESKHGIKNVDDIDAISDSNESSEKIKGNRKVDRTNHLQDKARKLFQKSLGNGKLECHICEKKLSSNASLRVHLEYHKDPKDWQYKCKKCGKKFARKPDLDAHMKKHTREQPFVCRYCGEKYGYKRSLGIHLSNRHSGEEGVEKEIESISDTLYKNLIKKNKPLENTNKVKCKNKESTSKNCKATLFKSKIRIKSKVIRRNRNETGEILKCEECGKQFKRNDHFKLHLEYHKDPSEWKFECEICGKKCVAKYKLKEHVARHQKEDKNGHLLAAKKKIVRKTMDKIDLSVGTILDKETTVSEIVEKTSRYGLRRKREKDFIIEDEIEKGHDDDDINESIVDKISDDKAESEIGSKNGNKSSVEVAVENFNCEDEYFDEMEEDLENDNGNERETKSLKDLQEDNLWTRKGKCFGDGTLVEFEDLD